MECYYYFEESSFQFNLCIDIKCMHKNHVFKSYLMFQDQRRSSEGTTGTTDTQEASCCFFISAVMNIILKKFLAFK